MEAGCCLGSDGNRVSMGEGGEGGPSPPGGGKDKKSAPNKGRDNMDKDEEGQPSQMWWRRIGANRVSSLLIILNFESMVIKFLILILFSFRRINHMVLKNQLHWSSSTRCWTSCRKQVECYQNNRFRWLANNLSSIVFFFLRSSNSLLVSTNINTVVFYISVAT